MAVRLALACLQLWREQESRSVQTDRSYHWPFRRSYEYSRGIARRRKALSRVSFRWHTCGRRARVSLEGARKRTLLLRLAAVIGPSCLSVIPMSRARRRLLAQHSKRYSETRRSYGCRTTASRVAAALPSGGMWAGQASNWRGPKEQEAALTVAAWGQWAISLHPTSWSRLAFASTWDAATPAARRRVACVARDFTVLEGAPLAARANLE